MEEKGVVVPRKKLSRKGKIIAVVIFLIVGGAAGWGIYEWQMAEFSSSIGRFPGEFAREFGKAWREESSRQPQPELLAKREELERQKRELGERMEQLKQELSQLEEELRQLEAELQRLQPQPPPPSEPR